MAILRGRRWRQTLPGEHGPFGEGLGGRTRGKSAGETDRDQTSGQPPRHDGRLRQEDGAGDEVGERRARGRPEQGRQDGTCAL